MFSRLFKINLVTAIDLPPSADADLRFPEKAEFSNFLRQRDYNGSRPIVLNELTCKANAAQKRLAASNVKTLLTHRYAALTINLLFILLRLFLRRKSTTYTLYIMYFLSASLAVWLQLQLEFVGRPKFDVRGGVVDPGSDLAQKGMTEYMFDVLYLTWGIQVLVATTTGWAWFLYLLVRGAW
jgi:hypothetical protein